MDGLDLGQEWYELSNYPMVWGVFAALKGNATPHLIRGMADAAAIAERLRQEDLTKLDDETAEFFGADLRFRFDDLATASISELTQYLYFYQGNDEIDELPVVHLPDDEADAEEQPLV
jgi:predicted solute-binding protein